MSEFHPAGFRAMARACAEADLREMLGVGHLSSVEAAEWFTSEVHVCLHESRR